MIDAEGEKALMRLDCMTCGRFAIVDQPNDKARAAGWRYAIVHRTSRAGVAAFKSKPAAIRACERLLALGDVFDRVDGGRPTMADRIAIFKTLAEGDEAMWDIARGLTVQAALAQARALGMVP